VTLKSALLLRSFWLLPEKADEGYFVSVHNRGLRLLNFPVVARVTLGQSLAEWVRLPKAKGLLSGRGSKESLRGGLLP